MIYTNNQIPKFTGFSPPTSLSCVAFDVAASQCRCNNSLGQKWYESSALQVNAAALIRLCGKTWHERIYENLARMWKMLLHLPRRPGIYNYPLPGGFWRFIEQREKNSSWLEYYPVAVCFPSPHLYCYQTDNQTVLTLKDSFYQVKLYCTAALAQRTIERQDLNNRKKFSMQGPCSDNLPL